MPLARLVLTEPWKAPIQVVIRQDPFLIGRLADCNLVLPHPSISKRHAQIRTINQTFVLEDLGSKNGTTVNSIPIQRQQLQDEDLITMGGRELIFQTVEQGQLDSDIELQFEKMKQALRLTSEISGASMLEQVLDQVITGLMSLTQAERGLLMIEKEGELEVARSRQIDPQQVPQEEFAPSRSAIERAVRTKEEVVVADASADTYFRKKESVLALTLKTLVCVPILSQDRVLGVLYADSSRKDRGFTRIDVEVLKSLATSAAIALENQQLNSRVQQLMEQASLVLREVEKAARLDESLQLSIRQTLTAINTLKVGQSSEEKPYLGFEQNLG